MNNWFKGFVKISKEENLHQNNTSFSLGRVTDHDLRDESLESSLALGTIIFMSYDCTYFQYVKYLGCLFIIINRQGKMLISFTSSKHFTPPHAFRLTPSFQFIIRNEYGSNLKKSTSSNFF